MTKTPDVAMSVNLVPTGLYRRLGRPWWAGVAALFALGVAAFSLVPDTPLLAGLAVSLGGGAVFGYRGRSFWWAVVAVVVAWLVLVVVTTFRDGWDVGPVEDVFATIMFGVFLAGATMLGGLVGPRLATGRSR